MHTDIPFKAAIFDLDGTLLDSLDVWRHVDERFFGPRHIDVPEDYSRKISDMSFGETVAYTIRRFNLPDTPDEVWAEWLRLAGDEYAHSVRPITGALAYLRALKRAGIRLAAATANRPQLFMPALKRCGLAELFDTVVTTGDIGDRNKADGALFRLAAKKLDAAPKDCAVFEDTLQGVLGARAAGMRAYAVRSRACQHCICQIEALADSVIDDFRGMRRIHPIPDNARRCVIFTGRCEGDPRAACDPRPDDFVIAADVGWRFAEATGVVPDLALGDFDSDVPPDGVPVERFPVEKDDTDTMLCVKRGLRMGFDDFLIVGGFGGRLDHTMANLQALNYLAHRSARAVMDDGVTWATVLRDGSVRVPRMDGKLGVFALDGLCRGVTIRGTKYEVEGVAFTNALPMGACNDFREDFAEIAVEQGSLLVTVSREGRV